MDLAQHNALAAAGQPDGAAFDLHPLLFDAVLHLLALDAPDPTGDDAVMVPYAWHGVRLHAMGATALRAQLRLIGPDRATLVLADPAGGPVASVESLLLRPVPVGELARAADEREPLGQVDGVVDWVPVPEETVTAARAGGRWAVVGGGDLANALAATIGADIGNVGADGGRQRIARSPPPTTAHQPRRRHRFLGYGHPVDHPILDLAQRLALVGSQGPARPPGPGAAAATRRRRPARGSANTSVARSTDQARLCPQRGVQAYPAQHTAPWRVVAGRVGGVQDKQMQHRVEEKRMRTRRRRAGRPRPRRCAAPGPPDKPVVPATPGRPQSLAGRPYWSPRRASSGKHR